MLEQPETTVPEPTTPWWSATDHVRIARIQLGAVVAALLLGVQLALVLQAELLAPGAAIVGAGSGAGALRGLLGAHGLVMIFLFALPALHFVVGGLVLPPMIGAGDFVSRGLSRSTLQLYLAAWILIALALLGGSIELALRDLPTAGEAASWALATASVGLHLLGLALACGAINLLATAIYGRSDHSTPDRWPVLVWGLVTGAAVQLVVGVAVAALGLLLLFETSTPAAVFAGIAADPFAYERLVGFILRAGAVVVVLPAIGVAFEIVATFCRKAPAGGRSNALSLAALGILATSGGGLALVNDGLSPALAAAASGISLLAIVPATVLLYNLLATFVGGAIEIRAPFLHALNLVVLLTVGGLAGIFLVTLSTGAYLQGSLFATAQLHFLLGGGATAGLVTGLYYWWPRLMGRSTSELLGRTSAALLFAGFLLAFVPSLVSGSRGLTSIDRFAQATELLDRAGALGALVVVLGLGVAGWDFLSSLLHGAPTEPNPWGATTGEWRKTGDYDFVALRSAARGRLEAAE